MKFEKHSYCPKCGNNPCPNNGYYWKTIHYAPEYKAFQKDSMPVPEHLTVTCVCCRYTWIEKPLDAKS